MDTSQRARMTHGVPVYSTAYAGAKLNCLMTEANACELEVTLYREVTGNQPQRSSRKSELLRYRPQTISATDKIGHSLYHIGHNGNQYRPQTIGLCLLDFLHFIVLVCFKCFGTCYFNVTVNLVSWSRFHHVFC